MHIHCSMRYIHRRIGFPESTYFLWGPRQSGKTTLLKQRYPNAYRIDLLRTDERIRYGASRRSPFGDSGEWAVFYSMWVQCEKDPAFACQFTGRKGFEAGTSWILCHGTGGVLFS